MTEAFKPIAVKRPNDNPALFWARCRIDLQLLTIYEFLRKPLLSVKGRLLDVGAGEAPWRDLMSRDVEYIAIDIDSSPAFGMRLRQEMRYYDGIRLPFADNSFDVILSTEVLEHVKDPTAFLGDLNRVLRRERMLILTAAWAARVHHVPHAYSRFSRFDLEANLGVANFCKIEIAERGNDIAVVANKLVVLAIRLLRPIRKRYVLWTWPGALIILLISLFFLCLAHASFDLNLG